jgi:hypothetical protein
MSRLTKIHTDVSNLLKLYRRVKPNDTIRTSVKASRTTRARMMSQNLESYTHALVC